MELQPEDPIAVNDLGVILAAQGNLAEAEQLFLRASEMNASYIEPCINLAGLYRMTGKMRECAFWGEKNRQLERMRKTGTLLDEGLMIEQK
jgi:Flp pilus assembly protein TadD